MSYKKEMDRVLRQFDDIKKQDQKTTSALASLNAYIKDVDKKMSPRTQKEVSLLKDLVNSKWHKMEEKIGQLHEEVFEMIMEQEMELARLETNELSDIIPSDIIKR